MCGGEEGVCVCMCMCTRECIMCARACGVLVYVCCECVCICVRACPRMQCVDGKT